MLEFEGFERESRNGWLDVVTTRELISCGWKARNTANPEEAKPCQTEAENADSPRTNPNVSGTLDTVRFDLLDVLAFDSGKALPANLSRQVPKMVPESRCWETHPAYSAFPLFLRFNGLLRQNLPNLVTLCFVRPHLRG